VPLLMVALFVCGHYWLDYLESSQQEIFWTVKAGLL